MRKDVLENGFVYHVYTKSIAEFKIFNCESEFTRMIECIRYYQKEKPVIRFSHFVQLLESSKINFKERLLDTKEDLIEIIAFCIMPTHIHLVLKQIKNNGISIFMSNILNSYTRYFNQRHGRKGPLWEGRFKNVIVETDEYLIHLTRYLHLNPVTAGLVERPEEWLATSYREYLSQNGNKICKYENILNIEKERYKNFVEDRIQYQKELAKIKSITLE
jgi:putative transposase